MNIKLRFLIALILFLFTNNIYSQPRNGFILNRDLTPVLDSLVSPPGNCDEAWSLVIFDTLTNGFVVVNQVEDQNKKIQDNITEITSILDQKKTDTNNPPPSAKPPSKGLPPGNHDQHGRGNGAEEFKDVWEDFQDANLAMINMTEIREQFKDEIKDMQSKVNEKLHNTLESDRKAHINIINKFMKFTEEQYEKHKLTLRENLKKVDAVVKKYDYGDAVKSSKIRSEILKMQLSQLESLKLLSNITKEFILIGSNFYREK
ncbi:MAG: hypothetical protein ABI462_03355 [Ignavibacteria bacterium]